MTLGAAPFPRRRAAWQGFLHDWLEPVHLWVWPVGAACMLLALVADVMLLLKGDALASHSPRLLGVVVGAGLLACWFQPVKRRCGLWAGSVSAVAIGAFLWFHRNGLPPGGAEAIVMCTLLVAVMVSGSRAGTGLWPLLRQASAFGLIMVALLWNAHALFGEAHGAGARGADAVASLGWMLPLASLAGGWRGLVFIRHVPLDRRLTLLAGALVMGTMVVIALAWMTGAIAWLKVPTVPFVTHSSTAIAMLGLGAALWFCAEGRPHLASAMVVPAIGLSLATLLAHLHGAAAQPHWLPIASSLTQAPSRLLGPNIAISLALASVGLLGAVHLRNVQWREAVAWGAGFVLVIVAMLTLFGYALDVEQATTWGRDAPMSPVTAIAVAVLGVGIAFAGADVRHLSAFRITWLPILVAGSAVLVTSIVWLQVQQEQTQNARRMSVRILEGVGQRVTFDRERLERALTRMAQRAGDAPPGEEVQAFRRDARSYLQDFAGLRAVAWVGASSVAQIEGREGRATAEMARLLDRPEVQAALGRVGANQPVAQINLQLPGNAPGLVWVMHVDPDAESTGLPGRAQAMVAALALEPLVREALIGVVPNASIVVRPAGGGPALFSQGQPVGSPFAHGAFPRTQPLLSADVWPAGSVLRPRLPLVLLLICLLSGGLLAVALRFSGLARQRAAYAERVQGWLAREVEARVEQQASLEDALGRVRSSEQRFHGMANAVADALWDWDLRDGSLWWSESVTRLFGHSPEDLGTDIQGWLRYIHPDDLDRVVESAREAQRGEGDSWSAEYRFARKQGGWAYVLDRGHVIRDAGGVAVRMVGGMTDLTERRDLNATIAREREFLAALLDSLSEAVVACDADGNLSHYTPLMAQMHGKPQVSCQPDEWARVYGLFDPETGRLLSPARVPLARALAGETVRDFEMLVRPDMGRPRLVQVNGQAVLSREGHKLGAVVTMRDISTQRRLELEREQLSRERGIVLEAMSEGLLGVDQAGACVFANRAASALLGEDAADLIATDAHALLHGEECLHRQIEGAGPCPLAVLAHHPTLAQRGDSRILLANGDTLPVTISVSPAPAGSGLAAVVTFNDISQRVREARVEEGKREVLALIAERRPVAEPLARLTAIFEASFPGAMTAIAVLDQENYRLRLVSPGSLPTAVAESIAQLEIGEHNGPCAMAAYTGERVVVTDLASDARWERGRELALEHGIRAGWCTPVRASTGEVLATLGIYYAHVGGPTQDERALVDDLAALAGVALEQSVAYSRLATSEQRFRSLFQEHPDAVYAFNAQGRFVAVNAGFEAMLGVEARSVIDHHFDELVAPEQREFTRSNFERALQGEAVTYESRGLRQDGSLFEVRVTNFPMVSDGGIVGVFGVAHDISSLRAHERQLARALAQAEEMGSKLRRLSQAGVRINSVPGNEALCQTLSDLTRVTLNASAVRIEVSDPKADGGARVAHSPPVTSGDEGASLTALVQADAGARQFDLTANDGRVLGHLQVWREAGRVLDETDVLVAEQLVQLASAAVERMLLMTRLTERDRFFEMSKEIFVVFDPVAGKFHQVNPTFCEVTGYDQQTLCARPSVTFLHPADRAAALERQALAAEQDGVRSFAARHLRSDGGIAWIEWTTVPGADGMVYGVGRDVTERTRAQVALQQSLADLATRNRELQDFAFVASHDLQEPLRKIRSFTDRLLRRHAESLDEQARDYLDRSAKAAARMQLLIENLLAYSRVTSQGKPFQQVDLERVVTGVLDDLEATIENAGATVEAGPLPTVPGDASQLGQVLQNLVANALKFRAPDRAPRVEVTAVAEPGEGGSPGWHLRVQDNGIGFEDKYGERIFAPFQRLHGRHEFEGTGIGLAIVRKIVERHRGRTWATGVPGEGACFHVWLPAETVPEDPWSGA